MRALLAAPLLIACLVSDAPAAGRPGATAVEIATAHGATLAFVPAISTVTTGRVALSFRNRSSLVHNLVFTTGLLAATRTIVEPGGSEDLWIDAPGPGAYPFVCTIHPAMSGVLVVRPPP